MRLTNELKESHKKRGPHAKNHSLSALRLFFFTQRASLFVLQCPSCCCLA